MQQIDPKARFPHEKFPMPRADVEGKPTFIVDKRTRRVLGREALRENIEVVAAVAQFVRTSLGPNGMDKLIIDKDGIVWVTNDGWKIMEKIDWEHPAGRLTTEVAKAVHTQIGDGVISTLIIAGEALKKCRQLLEKGIHPTVLANGCTEAAQKVLRFLSDISTRVDTRRREFLKGAVLAAMPRTIPPKDAEHLADIVTSAFLKVAAAGGSQVNLDCIDIKKKEGASLGESLMIGGLVYPHEIGHPGMPTRVENARIAVLKGEFKVTRTGEERKHGYLIENTNQLRAAKEEEDRALRGIVEKLVEVGANVVFVEKGIHPAVLDRLGTNGILGIRRMVIEDLERIANATGGRVATRINDLTTADLGTAAVVEERKISGQPWIFVEGCKNAKAVALLLRGVNKHLLSEAEALVKNSLRTLKSLKMKPMVVPGGGAAEMEAAVRLRQWSSTVRGPRHFVLRGLADALETVPATLAQTSGLDTVETLTELRALHVQGRVEAGINCLNDPAECSVEAAAYDPLIVKEQVVKSAFELASFILRVDDFIQARKLKGGEFDYAQRQKGIAPERVKRIKQEYGIES